jgi:hypothetical protein
VYWLTYTVVFLLFFLGSYIYAKVRHRATKPARHIVFALLFALLIYGVVYIVLHVVAVKITESEYVSLSPLRTSEKHSVYVLALSVGETDDTKKDVHVVSVNKRNAPSLATFGEGEARIVVETRVDAVLEKKSIRLQSWTHWLSGDQPWDEYIIRVPVGSIERANRIKNVL